MVGQTDPQLVRILERSDREPPKQTMNAILAMQTKPLKANKVPDYLLSDMLKNKRKQQDQSQD